MRRGHPILAILPLSLVALVFATEAKAVQHSAFVELGGNGGVLSLNYDVAHSAFSARIGTGGAGFHSGYTTYFLLLNYFPWIDGPHRLEAGAGALMADCTDCARVDATGFIGYRLQPVDGGFNFRVGAAGYRASSSDAYQIYPGLSFGYTF